MRKFFWIFGNFCRAASTAVIKQKKQETIPVANDIEIMDAPETMPEMKLSLKRN